jgi:hypothetical protein
LGDDAQGEEQDRETASSIWISTFHNAGTIWAVSAEGNKYMQEISHPPALYLIPSLASLSSLSLSPLFLFLLHSLLILWESSLSNVLSQETQQLPNLLYIRRCFPVPPTQHPFLKFTQPLTISSQVFRSDQGTASYT